MNNLIQPKIELDWDFMPVLVICKNEADQKKIEAATVFLMLSLWELYVAMATRVLIRSAWKPYATFPSTW